MFKRIWNYFTELSSALGEGWNEFWFTRADGATLGLMRLATGLVALYFAATFSFDLERFLGAGGMLPAGMVNEWYSPGEVRWWRFSYFSFVVGSGDLWAAHVVSLLVLALYCLGLFSRITSVLALIVVLSYVNRAPMLTGYLEPVLCLVMFYLCLGPSGAAFSLDSWRRRRKLAELPAAEREALEDAGESYSANIAQRLLQLHVALIYLLMGTAKLWGDTWLGGDAIWWLATQPESRLLDLTSLLARWPLLGDLWSHLVLLVELTFPLLVFNRLARPLALVASTLCWVSLALATGDIPWAAMMIIANLSFISGEAVREFTAGWKLPSRAKTAPAAR